MVVDNIAGIMLSIDPLTSVLHSIATLGMAALDESLVTVDGDIAIPHLCYKTVRESFQLTRLLIIKVTSRLGSHFPLLPTFDFKG